MAASSSNFVTSEAISCGFSPPMPGVFSTPPTSTQATPSNESLPGTESQAFSVGVPSQVTSTQAQRWKMAELRLLLSLKKDEYERSFLDTPRDRIKSADARWKIVIAGLLKYGFNRKQALIRKKWEKLMTDFKKIFYYQRRPPSGELGYFEMGSEDRKRFNLPPQYDSEVYRLMQCWVPGRRAVQPDPEQVMDSSLDEELVSNSGGTRPAASAAHTQPVANAEGTQAESVVGQHSEAGEAMHRPQVNGEQDSERDQPPTGEENSDSNAIPDHPAAQGRLLKKSRKDRLDDHFKNANTEMVKAMASQAERRELSDKALLDWEKEKHVVMAQNDLKKHTETVNMQEKMSGKISGALRDVSSSFKFFATEMSKRMSHGRQQD